MPADRVDETENEDDATHDESVSSKQALSLKIKAEFGKVLKGSPDIFFKRLTARLDSVGVKIDALDYRTDLRDPPPCFEMSKDDYAEWLRLAAVEMVPVRFDMPGEPNYCHDCTPEFKKRAIGVGACLFPNTRFEVRKDAGEKETVGVSRSGETQPDGYVVYQQMVVPEAALADTLRRYIRDRNMKALTREQMPKKLRAQFDRLIGPRSKAETHED